MKHKIAVDARMIQHSGIGTYLRGLRDGFAETGVPQEWDLAWEKFSAPIYSIREQFSYLSKTRRYDLWHAPHYNVPFFKTASRLVVTLHDLIHWIYRGKFFNPVQACYAQTMMQRAVRNAAGIIAVSEKTKQDLIEYFHAKPEQICVIYEGVSPGFKPCADLQALRTVRTEHRLPENFFLYVGLLKPHKNVLWLVRLFRRLFREKKIQSPLVVVGKKDRKYPQEFRELAALGRETAVIYLETIPQEDLQKLYSAALALVHPSLYEGFGLTLVEAMASGTPVAAFRAASIPEVAGDAGILLKPNDEEQMAETLRRLEQSESLRAECRQKGIAQAKRFQWRETARRTLEVYRQVLGS